MTNKKTKILKIKKLKSKSVEEIARDTYKEIGFNEEEKEWQYIKGLQSHNHLLGENYQGNDYNTPSENRKYKKNKEVEDFYNSLKKDKKDDNSK